MNLKRLNNCLLKSILLIFYGVSSFTINAQNFSVQSLQRISHLDGGLPDTLLESNDRFGYSVSVIGDVDKDGIDDIAVGAYLDDDGGTNKGAVYILFLNENGTVKNTQKISQLYGNGPPMSSTHLYFGTGIASLGDLNGDGMLDIAVGTMGGGNDGESGQKGAVYILFLDTTGVVLEYTKISNTQAGGPNELINYDYFGIRVCNMGDMNGDGIVDIAIGAHGRDDGGSNIGAIYLACLDLNGTAKSMTKISATTSGMPTSAFDPGDYFYLPANAGDINGDGFKDIVVGAPNDDDGGTDKGALWILFLDVDFSVLSYKKISDTLSTFFNELDTLDKFCGPLSLGDLDGDGINEIAVRAPNDDDTITDGGAIYIFYLDTVANIKQYTKLSCADTLLANSVSTGDGFLSDFDLFGDRNDDGKIDLLVGSYLFHDGTSAKGAAYVIHLEGPVTNPVKEYYQVPTIIDTLYKVLVDSNSVLDSIAIGGTGYGSAITNIGDFDEDGVDDVVVGMWGGNGSVVVQLMNEDGSVKSAHLINDTSGNFSGTLDAADHFGWAVANIGDLNGDGITDIVVGARADDDGGTNRGAVWILFLDTNATVKSHQKISTTQGGFSGTGSNNSYFGTSVAGIGDVNKDGIPDIAVGAHRAYGGTTLCGAVWILFLNTNGTVKAQQKISNNAGGFSDTLDIADEFGYAITNLGDINGDTITDIVIGVRLDDDVGLDAGAFYVIFLDTNGTVKENIKNTYKLNGFDGYIRSNEYFGSSFSNTYDLDRDGVVDFIAGMPYADLTISNSGRCHIIYMNSDGSVKKQVPIDLTSRYLNGKIEANDLFGEALAITDYNSETGDAKIFISARGDDDIPGRAAFYNVAIPVNQPISIVYSPLLKKLDASYHHVFDKKLRFRYDEDYKVGASQNLSYTIYNKSRQALSVPTAQILYSNGSNYFEINLASAQLVNGEFYTLEVINDKNEKMFLKFKVIPPISRYQY